MITLLDPESGKKHLNLVQPLHKLRWLQLNDSQLCPVPGRILEPVHFVSNICPRHGDMSSITDAGRLGSFLIGGYYPNGKDNLPARHAAG